MLHPSKDSEWERAHIPKPRPIFGKADPPRSLRMIQYTMEILDTSLPVHDK